MHAGNGELPAPDACNGHFGTVPANDTVGTTSSCVYHYHFTEEVPFTLGCYGPVESVEECKSLFTADPTGGTGCLDGFTDLLLADEYNGEVATEEVDLVSNSFPDSFSCLHFNASVVHRMSAVHHAGPSVGHLQ